MYKFRSSCKLLIYVIQKWCQWSAHLQSTLVKRDPLKPSNMYIKGYHDYHVVFIKCFWPSLKSVSQYVLPVQWSFLFLFRPGSVIIDFSMDFNQSVDGDDVVNLLKNAAQQNKFGDYKVDPDSIKQIFPSSTVTPGRIYFLESL